MTQNSTEQPTTRILLIRHAESVANAEERMQGSGNDPLTLRGRTQARELARRLQADNLSNALIFCSPLQRAVQTAEVVAETLGLSLQMHPGLREICLGKLENVDAETLAAVVRANSFAEYDAELPSDFAQRVIDTLSSILADYAGRPLVIITHLGIVCNALAYWLDGDTTQAWKQYGGIENTSISELLFDGSAMTLVCHGDACHLTHSSTP